MESAERPVNSERDPAVILRADARANRASILAAARNALSHSAAASMRSIARSANIGQGTMYRHFPSREALLLAVHQVDVQSLVDLAGELRKSRPAPKALREWLNHLSAYAFSAQGLAGALLNATTAPENSYAPILGAVSLLLDAGRATGAFRLDINAREVILLISFLDRLERDDTWEAVTAHLMDLVVDAALPRLPQ